MCRKPWIIMELTISCDGFQNIQLDPNTSHLDIVIDKRINASLLLSYSEVDGALPITCRVCEGSSLTVLLKKEEAYDTKIDIVANVYKDASLDFAYLDMENKQSSVHMDVNLMETGANVLLQSACIAQDTKDFHMAITHHVAYTTGTMKHYAIVKEDGTYRMEASGKIVKGAHGSESHQTTRVLTMSEQQDSRVIPLLLIDENDVKASHATTLGQPDENQLYYLQTRGLTRNQALGLLSVGYMMPISEVLDDEQIKEQLKNEIEMKVGLHA